MGEQASFTEAIKKALQESAAGGLSMPEEVFFVGQDEIKKGRFLSEWEGRTAIVMHARFQYMMPQPCLKQYGEPCPFHGDAMQAKETKTWYAWTLWSYEVNAKRLGLWKPSQNTPIGQMLDLFELKGTIRDRDALFTKSGKGPKTTTRVKMWLDPEPFAGDDVQPLSEARVLEIVKGMIKKRTVEELKQPLEFKKE